MTNLSDKELVAAFNEADEGSDGVRVAAFEEIVKRYSQKLYWTIRKIVVSHYDADDILQNSLVKLWQELPSFRGDSSLYTWLYKVAVNQALTHLRSRKRLKTRFVQTDDVAYFDRVTSEENLFDAAAVEGELQRAIQTLPEKQRTVFVLRYYDEMPYEEMSRVLETSEGALKASYHLAREKVEKQIKLSDILDV